MSTRSDLLSAQTGMGPVTLRVGDLDGMIAYYRDAVTLDLKSHEGDVAVLGRGDVPAVILQHAPGTFTGSADHLVSKAFYFTDPEGNGVELYWDRSRTEWSWVHGQIEMGTVYLDPNTYLQQHVTPELVDNPRLGGTTVGHVHLSVGDVATAKEFYVDRLGFETTTAFGNSALFVSAGGYHHHMAMNVWESKGAGRRPLALGLGLVEIVVPTPDEVGRVGERLTHFGMQTADDGASLVVADPWDNQIRIVPAGSAPAE
jgi:catechol 2,3-dioxygenase